jgi:hypothetical protein
MAIAIPSDFCKSLERETAGFANPCSQHNFVAEIGRCLVVDLVSQYHPADGLLCLPAGNRSPMGGGNILNPSKVNSVVHVILLVDIIRRH